MPSKKRSPKEVFGYLRELINPAYHWHKLMDDFRASRHALENRDLESIRHDVISLAKAIRGRLFAVYFMVGPFGSLGFFSGIAFQYLTPNDLWQKGVLTMLVTIIGGNIGSIIGYQAIWFSAHRSLYRDEDGNLLAQLNNMWHDVVPMQLQGIKLWVMANAFMIPALGLFISLLEWAFPAFVHAVPLAVVVPVLEVFFVHTTLVRLMGDLFVHESQRIAERHYRPLAEPAVLERVALGS
ncbi:MAG: hypothetical protein KIT11_05155 [Fimbriimonadaceae bacterium]|nr:hypothetical protein [Fimbriimonadaceae bacterium]QYK56719.1 MAG: hypothetical protein KF733_04365 [Fimbriimonadaceae bacterium]